MLKFQYRGTTKTVWLIGPVMKIGSAKSNEIVLAEEGVASQHCNLHVNENRIELEPLGDNPVFVNEIQLKKKTPLSLTDIVRIGTQEFAILDPQSKASIVPAATAPVSSEATVFRAPVNLEAAGEGSGWMIQALHPNLKNKRYPIDGTMALGRSQECELHFSFDRLSRKHAEFKVIDGVLIVKDLDSSNGTFVNGEKVKQAKLSAGDTVAFDKLEFTVIAPNYAGKSTDAGNLHQTVVRSALTPEMLKQAAAKPQAPAPTPTPEQAKSSAASLLMIAAGVVVLLIGAAFFFLK